MDVRLCVFERMYVARWRVVDGLLYVTGRLYVWQLNTVGRLYVTKWHIVAERLCVVEWCVMDRWRRKRSSFAPVASERQGRH